jgi:DNA modification methylase
MVSLFREVRRVLRSDGTAWVNMGDCYANDGKWGGATGGKHADFLHGQASRVGRERRKTGLKPKDLVGQPWRLAFALQDDGWWLRQDIIWHKPNPMPESVADRCTKAHEYLFLLSKSERYYFDAEAIAEPASENTHQRIASKPSPSAVPGASPHRGLHKNTRAPGVVPKSAAEGTAVRAKESFHASTTEVLPTRNKRSVWTVQTSPFPEAHFATFPPALIEPCILAGCPRGGVVLDPFGGAGTTGLVADRLQRSAILIELNPAYAEMARRRIGNDAPLFSEAAE